MAGTASPLDVPLHPDLCILAQCGRRLLRQAHAPSPQARRVPIRRGPASRHQPLRRRDKRRSQTLRLDRRSKARPRRCQTRETSVRVAPLEARLPTWRVVSRQSDKGEKIELMRTFEFESFHDLIHFMNTAARFIDRIDHHPEWTNIWRTLVVYLTTWDIGFKPSMLDVDLAAYLDDLYKNYVRKISQQDI